MRLRIIFALMVCALLGASSSFAQNFTAVSGTIVDPNGLPYSNCNITAELVPAGSNPSIGGAAIGGLNRANCDVNGVFSMTLGSNAVIVPGATQWKFTVNEQPGITPPAGFGPQSFTTTLTISGASLDISALLAVPALALARAGAAGPTAGVNALDTGSRADGAIGSNWKLTSNGLVVRSSAIASTAGGQINSGFWVANSFSNFQFSQVTVLTLNGTTDLVGPTVLNQLSGVNFYDCVENTTTISLRKIVAGVATVLASTASTGNTLDVLRLDTLPSNTLVCSKNGAPILTFVDATFTAGSAGAEITGNVASLINFFAGDLLGNSACSSVAPVTVNANVTTDQNLMSCILNPSALGSPGRTLKVLLAGVYSTPAASASVITVKLKLCTLVGCVGGTVLPLVSISSSALGGIQATNNPFQLEVTSVTVPGNGLINFEAHGDLIIDLSASAAAAAAVFADTNTANVGTAPSNLLLFLQTTIAFSVADPANSATARLITFRGDGP